MPTIAQPTVLLTGATGFLGSNLLRGLLERHASAIVLKRSWSDTWRVRELLPDVSVFDVDRTPLREVFESRPIDVVIHAATAYGRKQETASELLETNLLFPIRLLELAAAYNTPHFFNADSFWSRGAESPEGFPFYALSKRHFREYGSSFSDTSRVQFTNVQIEHMYGPDDDGTKFVPTVIRSLRANKPTLELTFGEQRRDFVYVDDVVAAFLTLLENRSILPKPAAHVEVGCGESESLRFAVQLLQELCVSDTNLMFGALKYRKGEVMASQADTSLLRQLGWSPLVTLREGLERTIKSAQSKVATA